VHEAARIAELAGASEILASARTLGDLGSRFRASSARSVTPEGMSEPIEVFSIEWR
jgi:class 3 adenylate cyclase